jgi:hypothetical protein
MSKMGESKEYLQAWLDSHRRAVELSPLVQEELEEVTWADDAIRNVPPEAANVPRDHVDSWAEINHQQIIRAFPQLPSFESGNSTGVSVVSSSTATANNAVISYLHSVGGAGPSANSYARDRVGEYNTILAKRDRVSQIRSLLSKRWPVCIDRFDAAVRAYQQFSTGIGPPTAAAIEMRTALDAVQGELYHDARYRHGERKDWSLIAERVGRNAESRQVLLAQGGIRSSIYAQLSSIAKRRPDEQTQTIEAMWSMFLNHLLAVLSC